MSNIVDKVFAEVCLDERISDGIFRMEEEAHMNALRDYFIKRGIPREASIHVTNRMLEGKFPDRQAYRAEDGILVTWPSPQHMAKAFKENPGKYVTQNPNPKKPSVEKEPVKEPIKREPPKDDMPTDDGEESTDSLPKSAEKPDSNLFTTDTSKDKDSGLPIEPPRSSERPKPSPSAPPTLPVAPRTPERIAAEKEVAMQIIKGDDHALTKLNADISETCHRQLQELYKQADSLGYNEAVTFLTPYVKPV